MYFVRVKARTGEMVYVNADRVHYVLETKGVGSGIVFFGDNSSVATALNASLLATLLNEGIRPDNCDDD